jgi:hypothetical protein
MTFVVADRVQENGTVATGTGSVTLAGAVNGYQSFASGIGNNNTTYYTIYDPVSYAWEVGIGTVTTGPNTLARTTVYANSSGTQPSKISFSTSDTLTVFVTYPAEIAIYTAASASLNSLSLTSPITASSNKGALNYGTLSYSDTGIFASYQTSVNSYAQMIIQNSNNGTAASADLVVSSDGGTASTNYGDFGINSSTFSGPGPLNAASMVYLYSQSTDLTIGTNTANAIHFTINNAATDALTINTTGSIAVNGQTGSVGQVLISQGSSNPPSWGNAGGNLVVTDFTATAGQTTFLLTYVVGTVSVYRNGIKLGLADFTATNGTSVVLATGAIVGDLIEIQSFTTLTLYSSITSQDFSGNGSTTAFTMSANPANSASVLVAINGVVQDPANYTVSGNTLTFTTAPATGTNNISCRYLGVPSTTSVSSFSAGTTGFSPTTAASGAVTLSGILVVANGGTGLNSLTSGYIPYGAGAAAFASSSGFNFNGTTLTSPALALSVSALTSSNIGNYAMGGALSFSDTGITSSEVGTTNSYLQAVLQNKSNGSLASAEYIVYNDQGTASTNYATVGINSSGYTGTGSINAAGYGYFLTGSTDLVLGTIGNNAIHFAVNSGAADAMYISSAGNVGIGTSSPTTKLQVAGNVTVNAGGGNTYGQFISGSSTIQIGTNGTTQFIYGTGAVPLTFSTNAAEAMRISSAGILLTNGLTSSPGQADPNSSGVGVAINTKLELRWNSTNAAIYGGAGGGDDNLYYYSGLNHIWRSNGTERMRIDSSGWLYIGRTAGGGRVNIQANTNNFMNEFFSQSGVSVGSIQTNGTSTSYVTTSDYRLKENVAPMQNALATVKQLKPVTYNWKIDGSASQGFIAHELQSVVPDCVTGEKDAVNEDGSIKAQGIDTSFLVATLTAAIQEQQALITDLQTRLTKAGL